MKKALLVLASLLALGACDAATSALPDHRVGVLTDPATGRQVAVAHTCPRWHQYVFDGLDNTTPPQFGCADSYNLASMVQHPGDLVQGRAPGAAEAAPGVLGIERYRENKTTPLINPKDIPTTTNN